jgi:hypothetical protein
MRFAVVLMLILFTGNGHATNATCVKYLEKILPYYDASNGTRTWAEQVRALCVNSELDAKEARLKASTDQANADVKSLTEVLNYAKRVSAQLRLQTAVLQSLKAKFENCRRSPVHKIDCSDTQLAIEDILSPLKSANNALIRDAQLIPEGRRPDFIVRLKHSNLILSQFAAKNGIPK